MLERSPSLDTENIEKYINRGTKRVEEGEEATPEMVAEVQKSREKRYAKLDRAESRQAAKREQERKERAREEVDQIYYLFHYSGEAKRIAGLLREKMNVYAEVSPDSARAHAEFWKNTVIRDMFKVQDLKKKAEIQWNLWDEFDQISERQRTKQKLSRADFVARRVSEMIQSGELDETEASTSPSISGDRREAELNSPRSYEKDLERDKTFLDVMDEFLDQTDQKESE